MPIHADHTQENKSQSVAHAVAQKQSGGEATMQFEDNRPEAVAQRKMAAVPVLKNASKNFDNTNTPTLKSNPIQMRSVTPSNTSTVHLEGPNKEIPKIETVTLSLMPGESLIGGEGTSTKGGAPWKGWIKNKKDPESSAYKLHMINRRWGGEGNIQSGNINMGSHELNDKHQIVENKIEKFVEELDTNQKRLVITKFEPKWESSIKGGINLPDGKITMEVIKNGSSICKGTTEETEGMYSLESKEYSELDFRIREIHKFKKNTKNREILRPYMIDGKLTEQGVQFILKELGY